MKNTLRALALAVPMAASIGLGATGAVAQTPVYDTPPIIVQPEQEPVIDPIPADPVDPVEPQDAPDDFAQPEDDNWGPDDIAQPEGNGPQGPGDITDVPDCPTHGVDCTPDEPVDEPEGETEGDDPKDEVIDGVEQDKDFNDGDVLKPTRVDAGDASDNGGLELALLLAGGAVIATGGAFAARRMARHNA